MNVLRTGENALHFKASIIKVDRPTLVFINSLGTDFRIWDGVIHALGDQFNIVLHDKRGHGLSDMVGDTCTIGSYAEDVINLLAHLKIQKAIFCGLSVGGLIAQQIYHTAPFLVQKLILSNTATKIGTVDNWNTRINAVRTAGIASISQGILERWFSPSFLQSRKDELALYRNMLVRTHGAAYAACCEAIRDCDLTSQAAQISVPTLCIGGEHDGSTTPAMIEATAKLIHGAQVEMMTGVGHLPCIEIPTSYAALLKSFIMEKAK